jgi:hypothetical protein
MPSLHNFRDAAESASMTPERLYRSAAPMGDVVDSDTVVHDSGVRVVIDLRDTQRAELAARRAACHSRSRIREPLA